MPRLGVYIIPEPANQLYRVASSILGWDVYSESEVAIPDTFRANSDRFRSWVGPAHNYGFHATIGDALEYPNDCLPEIEAILDDIAGRIEPFTLTNGRLHRTFRGIPRALAGTFDSSDRAVFRLEDAVVTRINVLHERSPIFSAHTERMSGIALEQFQRYGSPMVRSLFDLHFTLASGIPNSEIWRYLVDRFEYSLGLFRDSAHRTLEVNKIHLVEMRPDTRYRVRRSWDLVGTQHHPATRELTMSAVAI